jgi:hypothetical protein
MQGTTFFRQLLQTSTGNKFAAYYNVRKHVYILVNRTMRYPLLILALKNDDDAELGRAKKKVTSAIVHTGSCATPQKCMILKPKLLMAFGVK